MVLTRQFPLGGCVDPAEDVSVARELGGSG